MKILIIEDSERLRRSISHGLSKLGHTVELAADGEIGLALAKTNSYHVIILDLMLPKIDGFNVLKNLRRNNSEANIVILSARDQVNDRIKGLEMGADDYLIKPFSFEELCARITAVSRRQLPSKNPVLCFENISIDTIKKQVSCENNLIQLTASEYALLECLALQKGRTLTKNQLLDWLYSMDEVVTSNVIEVLMSALRRKIKFAGGKDIIVTRRGFGYMIK